MEKFVAFNLYGRNAYGAAVTRVLPDGEQKEVYRASDVEALLRAIKKELDDNDLSVARRMVDNFLMER